MKTNKSILKKVSEWEGNPMLVAGVYRLFVYLPWEKIPEKYKGFFPEEAKDEWDKDLELKSDKDTILVDIESELRAILNTLAKKNIINCLGIFPMIFADAFMADLPVGALQGKLLKVIGDYKENIELDMALAESLVVWEIFELIEDIVKKLNIKLSFDLKQAFDQVLKAISDVEKAATPAISDPNISKAVDDALVKEKEQKNETDV
jgi:hypothetical protein